MSLVLGPLPQMGRGAPEADTRADRVVEAAAAMAPQVGQEESKKAEADAWRWLIGC